MQIKSTRKRGLFLLITPWVLLFGLLIVYPITSFVIAQTSAVNPSMVGVGHVLNLLMRLSGLLIIVWIFFGVPLGIWMIVKSKKQSEIQDLSDSAQPSLETYVSQWSLGAFLVPEIWTFGNKLYGWGILLAAAFVVPEFARLFLIGVIGFLPVFLFQIFIGCFTFFVRVYLLIRGRRLAWKRGWQTVAQFQKRQKLLLTVIVCVVIISIVASVIFEVFDRMSEPKNDPQITLEAVNQAKDDLCTLYADEDQDYLTTRDEKRFQTDPLKKDTDGDGYDDFSELLYGFDAGSLAGEEQTDTDQDGLSDAVETFIFKSNRSKIDSDGDGVSDLEEVHAGINPASTHNRGEQIEDVRELWLADYAQKLKACPSSL